jgi:hypothetical protein
MDSLYRFLFNKRIELLKICRLCPKAQLLITPSLNIINNELVAKEGC